MIPLRDQDFLRQRFQRDLTSRVRVDFFSQKPSSIFIPGRQECVLCSETQTLMEEIASLSERITLNVHDLGESEKLARDLGVDKVPGIVIRGQTNRPLRFFGLPSGNPFLGFVETMIDAATGQVRLQPDSVKQLRKLKTDVKLQVMVTPTCEYSATVSRAAWRLALQSVRVKADVIEVSEFPQLVQRFGIRGTPTTIIGENLALIGTMDEQTLVENVLRVAEGKPFTGNNRVGDATVFTLPAPKGSQQQRPQRLSSSGLILPP